MEYCITHHALTPAILSILRPARLIMSKIILGRGYPQFTRKTVRRHKICVLLRCFRSMYARYMSFKSALYPAQILCLLTLETSNGENFFIFKADEEGVPGSTLIEDNAENEEIITLRRVVPCKLRADAGKEKAPFRASFHQEGRPKLYPFLGGTGVPAVCYRPASDDIIFMAYEGADILSCFSRSGNI